MNKALFQKFVYVIKAILIQSQIIGFVTFKVTEKQFQSSNVRRFVNILAILCLIPLSIYAGYLTVVDEHNKIIYKTTNIINLIAHTSYIVTIWICGITYSEKTINFLIKMVEFDEKLHNLGLSVDVDKERRTILHRMIGRIIVMTILTTSIFTTYVAFTEHQENFNIYLELIRSILLIIKAASCHQIIVFISMIKLRFLILNEKIADLAEYVRKYRHGNTSFKRVLLSLCKICELHHLLFKIVKRFNEAFGVVLLFLFGVSFTGIVTAFFYVTANLQANPIKWLDAAICVLISVPFIIDVVYVCNICYRTVEEAGRTGEILHQIETEDQDIIDEVEMFSLQITNEQIEFSAAYLFPVNHELLFAVAGGVTTYIIILIQLSATIVK